jgi:branched-chain amino acid aminotransferase
LDNVPFKKQWKDSLGITIQNAYKNLVLEKEYKTEETAA